MIEVEVIISDETREHFPLEPVRLQNYAVRVFESCGISESDVNIIFVDDICMTELNEKYKGRKGSTDVLSFDLSEEDSGCIEGEVYVSLDRARQQAVEYGVPYAEEVIRLVTHGLLHLTGRVHDTDEEYKDMAEDTERFVETYYNLRF